MKKYHLALHPRHATRPRSGIATLGWTQFAIIAAIVVAILMLAGFAVWPW